MQVQIGLPYMRVPKQMVILHLHIGKKIQPITEALKINVIANGEIWNNADAKACLQQSNCQDIMIGRGTVTTPDLTLCIRENNDNPVLSWQDLVELQQRFLSGQFKTEIGMIGRYKQWLGMMTKAYPEAQELWTKVKKEKQLELILQYLK